ncbi:TlpA disulfide reductase family protein [Thalassomonas sp. M1454]|uniref:TlpA disulfide reductase family protein n=1 Tax=Thalassomonas sp. M1454 TaxID=2594477 RepID=UPI00118077CF|nr:TlpA disulfide reductase family protein [Thalassomonas sp. M1454]TRX53489.1 TlpA family protein disulfide reductase [Thalassomonas sp. M1454]
MKIKLFVLTLLLTCFNFSSFANDNSKAQLQQLLDANKGKVIYLDFWASWCIPCRKSFPWMNEMEAKYKDKGFKVITINLDVEKELAEEFLLENPANFTVLYDPKGIIAKEFKLKGMPSSYLIGKDGQPKSAHVGFFNDKKASYEAELVQLMQN